MFVCFVFFFRGGGRQEPPEHLEKVARRFFFPGYQRPDGEAVSQGAISTGSHATGGKGKGVKILKKRHGC